jgi:hypothetical protein
LVRADYRDINASIACGSAPSSTNEAGSVYLAEEKGFEPLVELPPTAVFKTELD